MEKWEEKLTEEILFRISVLKDRDNAGLQNTQSGNVVGQNTKLAIGGGDVDLGHGRIGVIGLGSR